MWHFNLAQEEPDGSPWIWSARVNVRYTGLNQIQNQSFIVDGITANNKKAAMEIAGNVYKSSLEKEWPELVETEVSPIMRFDPKAHAGQSPHLRDKNAVAVYNDGLIDEAEYLDEAGNVDWKKLRDWMSRQVLNPGRKMQRIKLFSKP